MAQLLSNLPVRALVKFGKHQVSTETAQPIIWMVAAKNHSGYPSNSVTLITQKCIDLRAYDGTQTADSQKGWNGNANYKLSNIHQWLNSEKSTSWYSASESEDAPPTNSNTINNTAYSNRPGFLSNFTFDERQALLPTTIANPDSSYVDEKITTKVFLPSMWECLGTFGIYDGSKLFACFDQGGAQCSLTQQAFTNTTSTSKPATSSTNWFYMTRSNNSPYVYGVSETGVSMLKYPYDGSWGVRPVVNLSNNIVVSDTLDSDGCYRVIFNSAPTISGTNGDLGIKRTAFLQAYSVNDTNSDAVTVTEYIDNVRVRSYVATLGATNTFAVTGNTWLKLANGVHTLKITATDGIDEVTRTFTFTKSVTKLVVQRSSPIDSTTRAKSILVTVVKVIPPGAIFKVEACNNAFDAVPTWEDITARVVQGRIYDFSNTFKTSAQWGVNIRVTVDRNGSEGACYITEIGGNFE